MLVVEDDACAAETLAAALKSGGHQVRVAHDGSEALRVARDQRPEAVLLDLNLPGMDGYEVARRLRREAGLGTAKIVAFTGDERAWSGAVGFEELLLKPVDVEALSRALGHPQ